MRAHPSRFLVPSLVVLVVACGDDVMPVGRPDASADTGVASDVAVVPDAPPAADGPPVADTGPRPDVGTESCVRDEDCADGTFCNGAERCGPGAAGADGRGCVADEDATPCMASQTCDETDDRCETVCSVTEDADGDGALALECGGDDCDDADGDRFPAATEVCDIEGHDEDCDPATFGERDVDGDSAVDAICCNGTTCGTDCDDLRRGTNPGAPEVCDRFDNDCDDNVDEGVTVMTWPDMDFDLHGDRTAMPELSCAGAFGRATVADDCADRDPAVHTAQVEICDNKDNDCDGDTDEAPAAVTWYVDGDGDGFGSDDPTMTRISCTPLPGFALRATDCDDTRAGVSPSTPERCDGLDNDCSGRPDFLLGTRNTEDDDLDGFADAMCPSGEDCNDTDPTSFPQAAELCDLRDNDCNGMVDDGQAMGTWYVDRDGDSFGDDDVPTVMSCTYVRGRIPRGGDCDDSTETRRPGAAETCNGADDDCDGRLDEGSDREPYYVDADGDGLGAGAPLLACTAPVDRVANATDCNDMSRTVGAARVWYVDADADGYGDALRSELACAMPMNRIATGGDCDDGDNTVRPMAVEACDGADDDCDGATDEMPAASACLLANASATCMAGACGVVECASGYGNCDAMAANGCEIRTDRDRDHCGRCNMACPAGEACSLGECTSVAELAAGSDSACARMSAGTIKCWGGGGAGQLGRGDMAFAGGPGPVVRSFTGDPITDATRIAGHGRANHYCAIRADRTVWCWGSSANGQCGPNGTPATSRAVPVPGVANAVDVSVGVRHSCAVTESGTAYCWGHNQYGTLGVGANTTTSPYFPAALAPMRERTATGNAEITDAVAVSAGSDFTCVVHRGGTRVSCVGRNDGDQFGVGGGKLGRGSSWSGNDNLADEVVLPMGSVVTSLDSGEWQTCAIRSSGSRPVCWGVCINGLCSSAASGQTPTPVEVELVLAGATRIFAGTQATCMRNTHPTMGEVMSCFGGDADGILGDGTAGGTDPVPDSVVTSAAATMALPGTDVFAIGGRFACAGIPSGGVTCWGLNENNASFGVAAPSSRAFADVTAPMPNVP